MALALVTLLVRLAIGQAGQAGQAQAAAAPQAPQRLPEALSQTDILNAVVAHKADFARCNSDNPGPDGTAVLHWLIAPDGQPHDVQRIGGDLQNPAASSCLEEQVRSLRFGRYQGSPMPPVDFPFSMGSSPAMAQPGPSDAPASLRQDIMRVMVAHKDDVARCKKDHPAGGGTVVMHWQIEPDGQTSEVRRSGGDLDNPELFDCLSKLVGSLRFASHPGSRLPPVDFPMSF